MVFRRIKERIMGQDNEGEIYDNVIALNYNFVGQYIVVTMSNYSTKTFYDISLLWFSEEKIPVPVKDFRLDLKERLSIGFMNPVRVSRIEDRVMVEAI